MKFNELELLDRMNNFSTTKYDEMRKMFGGVDKSLKALNRDCLLFLFTHFCQDKTIVPLTNEIGIVENNVIILKEKVDHLNSYVKQIEQLLLPFLK